MITWHSSIACTAGAGKPTDRSVSRPGHVLLLVLLARRVVRSRIWLVRVLPRSSVTVTSNSTYKISRAADNAPPANHTSSTTSKASSPAPAPAGPRTHCGSRHAGRP